MAVVTDIIGQQVTLLQQQIIGWQTDLANDAGLGVGGTQPDYSLDGENVNRQAWRDGLQRNIDKAMAQLQKLQPYELESIGW